MATKKALEGLMEEFARRNPSEKENLPDWGAMIGIIKDDYKNMTSVELQHSIWRIKNDYHGRYKRIR